MDRETIDTDRTEVEIHIDKLQITCNRVADPNVLEIPGFTTESDKRARNQTSIPTYARVRTLRNAATGSWVYIQYQPLQLWLPLMKVTLGSPDDSPPQAAEIAAILRSLPGYRLLLVEVAFDFSRGSVVNRDFVRRHGLFGKSRSVWDPRWGRLLRYGTRKSAKLVRAYFKKEIAANRIEPELHGAWFRLHGIHGMEQLLLALPKYLSPHMRFVRFDFFKLASYLRKHGLPHEEIIAEATARSASLDEATKYLTNEIGVRNIHRFRKDLPITQHVSHSLRRWALHFWFQFYTARETMPRNFKG